MQKQKAYSIIEKLQQKGFKAYLCGGCVRDALLGVTPKDYDIVSNATPDEVCQIFPRTVEVGVQFGIVSVLVEREPFEVATFRKDGEYKDGRHPEKIEEADEVEDAKRRDFTINGLFFDISNDRIIDYVRGQDDISLKIIRTINSPEQRFQEDYLRMMRAIRFACQLDFDIENKTWWALQKLAHLIENVSFERIRDEILRMLEGPRPEKAFRLLLDSRLLGTILPEIEKTSKEEKDNIFRMLEKGKGQLSAEIAWAILFYYVDKDFVEKEFLKPQSTLVYKLCRKFRLSNHSTNIVLALLTWRKNFFKISQMSLAEKKKFLRLEHFEEHLKFHKIFCLATQKSLDNYHLSLASLSKLREKLHPPALLNGKDLSALGISPGPIFKEILSNLEEEQLEEKITTRNEAIFFIEEKYGYLKK